VTLHGRIQSVRKQGKKLMFLQIGAMDHIVHACIEHSFLGTDEAFETAQSGLVGATKGSYVEVEGMPRLSAKGRLQLMARRVKLLSTCLHRVPEHYTDIQKRMRHRHIDFMVNVQSKQTMLTRSKIVHRIRSILHDRDFVEVETPVLQASASGAAARPFTTKATIDRDLQLKIAPELALKRAVVGGLLRVFELGKCFRNERLSPRHNPEFTTCEYYEAFGTLEKLITDTQTMLRDIEQVVRKDSPSDAPLIFEHFQQLDFVKTLEQCLGETLPRTQLDLLDLFARHNLTLPTETTIPELLDSLAGLYLEPLCQQPTFLVNHPAELSSLAKSTDGISHRFELIVNGVELINAYEEENDPLLQRVKFEAQAKASGRTGLTADEDDYCKVLEWGMPPTAGWGLGVDRLCMLLCGQTRINEVLLDGGI
ncbi:hypothetical protein BCR37DRAFT_331170, partial [Protomyces lactucae-debilis]